MTQKKGMLSGIAVLLGVLMLAGLALAMYGCVGGDNIPAGPPSNVDLGPLPNDPGPAHNVATLDITTIQGSDTFLRSNPAHVLNMGTPPCPVRLNVSGGFEYAMYQFSPAGNPLINLMLDFTEAQGLQKTWVAVSDFGTSAWRWYGPYHAGPIDIPLAGGMWTDAAGIMYYAVVMHTGGVLDMKLSQVTVDKP